MLFLFCVSKVMVFVHARNATVRTAMALIEMAKNHGEICCFQSGQGPDYGQCEKQVGPLSSSLLNPFIARMQTCLRIVLAVFNIK